MEDNLNDKIIEFDKISNFLLFPIGNDLLNVPGIDHEVKMKLEKHNITCIYHLFSLYFTFYPINYSSLKKDEIYVLMTHRANQKLISFDIIDQAKIMMISSAIFQKIDCMLPGFFDINC
jgi:hypothetical protein